MHSMNWDDLRYILALSRTGSLSGAGDLLGVVHTTVGRRLRAIEDALGVRLFDKTPEGFVTTTAGAELVATAQRLEAEILGATSRLAGQDVALQGPLRVSTLDFVYEGFLEVFTSFMARYPGIALTVCSTNEQLSLLRREADVVLRLSAAPPDNLFGVQLGVMQFAPYASRALVARVGQGAALGAYPWLFPDEREDNRWLDQWLAQHAPGASPVMRVDAYPAIRASVRAGVGVFFLPCFEAEADPALVRVGPLLAEQARPLWLLTLAQLRTNSRVSAFMAHVRECFSHKQAALAGQPAPPAQALEREA